MESIVKHAKKLAYLKHDTRGESQRYGDAPYSKHLDDVVKNIEKYIYYIDIEDREDMLACGYLHDIVEDTEISPSDLRKMFNEKIADTVFRVTNERGFNRKEKNFKTYPKIWTSRNAIFLKLCDRLANSVNSKKNKKELFKMYVKEYPVFRYALKIGDSMFKNLWKDLDKIMGFKL